MRRSPRPGIMRRVVDLPIERPFVAFGYGRFPSLLGADWGKSRRAAIS